MNKYSPLIICVLILTSCQPKHDVPTTVDLHKRLVNLNQLMIRFGNRQPFLEMYIPIY